MRFSSRWIRGLLLCLLPAACAAPPCGPEQSVAVPVLFNGVTPLVTVQVNGMPATMVLDTGASETAFLTSGVKRLGIVPDATPSAWAGGANGFVRVSRAKVSRLALGPLAVSDVSRAVFSFPALEAQGPTPVDGLPGLDILSQADLDLDLPNHRVTLYPTSLCQPGKPNWLRPAIALPTWQTPNLRLGTQVELDGQVFQALIDTGAGRTTINQQATALLKLSPAPADARRTPVRGIGDAQHELYYHRFRDMVIGPTRFPNPILAVTSAPGYGFQAAQMVLGSQYTHTRRLWLSYAARQVWVQRPAATTPPEMPPRPATP